MANRSKRDRERARVSRSAYAARCLSWLLRLFSGSAPGVASLEQVIAIGLCALSGLVAFKHFGAALSADLRLQADRITGPGLPSANTFELSPEDLISGLGGDRDPGGPELCRLDGTCTRPGQCFAAGTLVSTADGLRGIETIRTGERVWARDVETGALELKAVTATFVRLHTPIIELELRAGALLSERLSVTPGHRFWIEGGGWTQAASLAAAPVGSFGSPVSASALSTGHEVTTVYNLEVEDFHSYFVGQAGALVHNGDDDDEADGPDPNDCNETADGDEAGALSREDLDKRMQALAEQAYENVRNNPERLGELLSEAECETMDEKPFLKRAFFGTAVERELDRLIGEDLAGMELEGRVEQRSGPGPDYTDTRPADDGSVRTYDVTTDNASTLAEHERRRTTNAAYEHTVFLTYPALSEEEASELDCDDG